MLRALQLWAAAPRAARHPMQSRSAANAGAAPFRHVTATTRRATRHCHCTPHTSARNGLRASGRWPVYDNTVVCTLRCDVWGVGTGGRNATGAACGGGWTACRVQRRRAFSSRGDGGSGSSGFDPSDERFLEVVPYKLDSKAAWRAFAEFIDRNTTYNASQWVDRESWTPVEPEPGKRGARMTAVYMPFWAFDATIVAETADGTVLRRTPYYPESPTELRALATQVYAGHSFRRPLVHAAVRMPKLPRTEVFSGKALTLPDGTPVDVDAWSTHDATALDIMGRAVVEVERSTTGMGADTRVRAEDIVSRRVMLPVFLFEYPALGEWWRVHVNGVTGQHAGLSHPGFFGALKSDMDVVRKGGSNALTRLLPQDRTNLVWPALVVLQWLSRIVPLPLVAGAAVVTAVLRGAYKRSSPLRERKASFQEWRETVQEERQRQRSATFAWSFRGETPGRDRGHQRHKESAKQQQEHRQQQQQQNARTQARRNAKSQARAKAEESRKAGKARGPPRVDPGNYYALYGLQDKGPAATQAEVNAAFRKEMMRWHPDTNQTNPDVDLEAAGERTRQLLEAHKTMRSAQKRAEYDKQWRRIYKG